MNSLSTYVTHLKTLIPKIKENLKPLAFLASGIVLGYLIGFRQSTVQALLRATVENEQMRFADEGMLRSRTNFARPGVTQEQVDQIKQISDDYGIPDFILYSMYRTERGRMGLYLGANHVDPEIRLRYSPLMWQFAKGAKNWNLHLNKTVIGDPYLEHRVIYSFAKQWNPDADKWTAALMMNLDQAKGPKGLEVTEPPKSKPKKAEMKKSGNTRKAKGGGHKSSKQHKEQKR